MALLDWLRYFPLARDPGDAPVPTEIRGPYRPQPKSNQWLFGDCVLHFDAPRANPILGFDGNGRSIDGISPRNSNILTSELDRVYNSSSDAPKSEWDFDHFYKNKWFFAGPWFTGSEACLEAIGTLCTADNNFSFFDRNLFHPKVFESAIANYLDNNYGCWRSGKKPYYRGPLNWKVISLSSSIQAALCDVHQIHNGSRENPDLLRMVFLPVTPNQFIRVAFNFGGISIARDEMRSKPILALCDSIINSFRLEVGKDTQTEWDKVKATSPEMTITDTFAELPWPLFKEKPNKKRKEVDITQSTETREISDRSHHQKKK